MKGALIAVGVVVLLAALVAVVGTQLPQGHIVSVAARYGQPPAVVWATVTDFAAWPTWNPAVKKMAPGGERNGRPVWTLEASEGIMPTEVVELAPPDGSRPGRLVTRIADDTLAFGGTWMWEIAADGNGSRVTITEDGDIYNPVFRALARGVFGYTGTAEAYLKALGEKFGERVAPEAAPVRHIVRHGRRS